MQVLPNDLQLETKKATTSTHSSFNGRKVPVQVLRPEVGGSQREEKSREDASRAAIPVRLLREEIVDFEE